MNDITIDQADEQPLTCEVTDEALEAAATVVAMFSIPSTMKTPGFPCSC